MKNTIILERPSAIEPITRTQFISELFTVARTMAESNYSIAFQLMETYIHARGIYFSTWDAIIAKVGEPIRESFYADKALHSRNALMLCMQLQRELDNDETMTSVCADKAAGMSTADSFGEAAWSSLNANDINGFKEVCNLYLNIKSMMP